MDESELKQMSLVDLELLASRVKRELGSRSAPSIRVDPPRGEAGTCQFWLEGVSCDTYLFECLPDELLSDDPNLMAALRNLMPDTINGFARRHLIAACRKKLPPVQTSL